MKDFLNNRIYFEKFDRKFLSIWSTTSDENQSWEKFTFKLNQFNGLSLLTSKLFEYLDIFETDTYLN